MPRFSNASRRSLSLPPRRSAHRPRSTRGHGPFAWLAEVLKPPNYAGDPLPPDTPWRGVIVARACNHLTWAVSVWIVLDGLAACAAVVALAILVARSVW